MEEVAFPTVKDGEWVTPVHENYEMQCCDCDLTHRMDFRVLKWEEDGYVVQDDEYIVQFRAYRL